MRYADKVQHGCHLFTVDGANEKYGEKKTVHTTTDILFNRFI